MEIYRELIREKQLVADNDEYSVEKRKAMKSYLKDAVGTDKIDEVNLNDLK